MSSVHHVTTTDGRTLEVHEDGDPDGLPVVVHHGTPMSGVAYEPYARLAAEQGIRVLGYDRPGYGGSTRHRGRSVAAAAADVTAIADALGLARFASWGISGGGPHVLACAALCDERLTAAASLASVAPYGAEGLDWLAGMGEDNHLEFGLTLEGEEALRPWVTEQATHHTTTVDELVQALSTLLGDADRAVLTGAFADYMIEADRHAFAAGVDGWIDDDLAFARPWGFDVASVARPVLLLHGEDDVFVPVSHGRWLAGRLPGVEARIDAADGHLTLVERRLREVNDWLLRHS